MNKKKWIYLIGPALFLAGTAKKSIYLDKAAPGSFEEEYSCYDREDDGLMNLILISA